MAFKETVLPTFVPAIPSFIFCLIAKLFIDINSWLMLLTVSAISAVIYICFIVQYGLREQDKVDLSRLSDVARVPLPLRKLLKHLAS